MQRPTNLYTRFNKSFIITYLILISFCIIPFISTAQGIQTTNISETLATTSNQANTALCSVTVNVPGTGTHDAYESNNCGNAFFIFTRESSDLSNLLIFDYTIGGTATSNVDYTGIPSSPVIIPAGLNEIIIPVTVIPDDILEEAETLTLFLSGECNCENTEVTLNIFDLQNLHVDVFDTELCSSFGTSAIVSTNVMGGVPLYTYDWGEGLSPFPLFVASPTESTSYTVTVTDMCGSEGMGTGTVNVSNISAALEGNISLCGDINDAFLYVTFFGSEGPFDLLYSIDGVVQSTLINIFDNPYRLPVTQTGIYTLESVITDGCIGETIGIVDVVGSGGIEVTSTFSNPTCADVNSGSIDLTIADLDEEVLTYLWSNGSTLEDQENLPAGDYSVTITTGWCETIEEFVLLDNSSILISADVLQIDCINLQLGAIDITVSGGNGDLTYSWSNGANGANIAELEAGTYSVTVIDVDNCSATQTFIIDPNSDLLYDLSTTYIEHIDCRGNANGIISLGVDGTEGLMFNWPENAGGQTGSTATNLASGSYIVTITNAINCLNFLWVDITEPDSFLIFNPAITSSPSCYNEADGTINLSASGGDSSSYFYIVPDYPPSISGIFTEVPAGEYEVSVFDGNACMLSQTVIITNPEEIIPTIELTNTSCETSNNSIITITATGGTQLSECNYIYSIEPELPSTECGVFVEAHVGTYTITVEDAQGCQVFPTVEIPEFVDLAVEVITQDASCSSSADGMANIQVIGGTPPYEGNGLIENLIAGAYIAIVTDANGCEIVFEYVINAPLPFSFDFNINNASTGLSNDGSIILANVQGGTPPYTYFWSTGATTEYLINAHTGSYYLAVTDAQFCVSNYTFYVDATVATENSLASKTEFSLHPNLVQKGNEPVLFINAKQDEMLEMQVISTSGKLLLEKQKRLAQGDNEIEIATASLPAGLYFLKLQLNSSDYSVVKFVVL